MYTERITQRLAIPVSGGGLPPLSRAAATYGTGEINLALVRRVLFIVQASSTMGAAGTIDFSVKGSNTASTAIGSKTAISSSSITQITQAGAGNVGPGAIGLVEVTAENAGFQYIEGALVIGTAASVCAVLIEAGEGRFDPISGSGSGLGNAAVCQAPVAV